jgi:pimeloyl-ACP methyl ester carboxylesterase
MSSHAPTRRRVLATLGLAATAPIATTIIGSTAASADPAPHRSVKPDHHHGSKPTVVLVHGAFAESSSWNGVIDLLLADGFPVIAVANPLRGVRNDSEYLASIIEGIEGPLVLVGHSYGGVVITNAAEGHDRVAALVYIGGFAPDVGESAADLAGQYEGGTLGETLVAFDLPDGNKDLYILQDKYRAQFAADVPEAEAARMGATQRPIVEAALNEPSAGAAWKSLPSWFLFGELDKNIPVAAHRFMAERARARRSVELAGGSHSVGIPEAAQVVQLVREAALATSEPVANAS